MHYVIVFQVLCGCLSAHVAGRKGRSRPAWWLMGALLPAFGLVLSFAVPPLEGAAPAAERAPARRASRPRKRPRRCCGSYIPDCLGCSYYRRLLFDPARAEGLKGHCEYFDRDLVDGSEADSRHVTIEDG